MSAMSSVGPVAEALLMDFELMGSSRARRVNGYIKRSDRQLNQEKAGLDTELKKRLSRLDSDMNKMKIRSEQLKREKENRVRNQHLSQSPHRRGSGDCVDAIKLPVLPTNGGLVGIPCDIAGSAPDVRQIRSRDSSPVTSSRRGSAAPGLREALLKSSVGLPAQTGSDVIVRGRRPRAHSRSCSLPNMRRASVSPTTSPLLPRRSRKEAFIAGLDSAATSRESSRDSSCGRQTPVLSRDSSPGASCTSLVYCPKTEVLYAGIEDELGEPTEEDEEGRWFFTILLPEWEAEDEVDKVQKNATKKQPKVAPKWMDSPVYTPKDNQPATSLGDSSTSGAQSQAISAHTISTEHASTTDGPRSYRQLKALAEHGDGYHRDDVTDEQTFMEDTQGPETLAAMFEKLKACRYLRIPGQIVDPLGDADDIFDLESS